MRLNISRCMIERVYRKGWNVARLSKADALRKLKKGALDWASCMRPSLDDQAVMLLSLKQPTHRLDVELQLWKRVD